ncbi:MAG: hypothetical protein Q8N20_06760 [Eubacteriales bacterium]|nr:hypothetical protein [Eubacteriales bacterium]
MQIERALKIAKRTNDVQYVKYILRRIEDQLFLRHYLPRLTKYHGGANYNFQSVKHERLVRIMEYAYHHSRYYNGIFKNVFNKSQFNRKDLMSNWIAVPFLDKDIIRQEISNILTLASSTNYVGHVTTGGSTGQPLGFYALGGLDAQHQTFLFKMMGYRPGDSILAMDGSVVPDSLLKQNIFWVAKNSNDLPYGRVALSSLYLSRENIDCYINFLGQFKPTIIRGYPSFVYDIANYALQNNIEFSFNCKGVELTSESFYDYQIETIYRVFKAPIYNQYGHAEGSVFGYSTDNTLTMYCSPLYGYTEIIGENNQHVKQGEIGEVVVTGFANYAMPFIRYRTGDLAIYDGEENGIVRLQRIYGRTQDYIYQDNMEKVLLTAIVFGMHYQAFSNINRWQIVQNVPGKIIFLIVKQPSFSMQDEIELKDNFYKISNIQCSFEYVQQIPLTPGGKSKFLIQNIVS